MKYLVILWNNGILYFNGNIINTCIPLFDISWFLFITYYVHIISWKLSHPSTLNISQPSSFSNCIKNVFSINQFISIYVYKQCSKFSSQWTMTPREFQHIFGARYTSVIPAVLFITFFSINILTTSKILSLLLVIFYHFSIHNLK